MKYQFLFFLMIIISCNKPLPKAVKALNQTKESIVFIAGFDEGDNTYYTNAKNYFKSQGLKVIDNLYSIAEIVAYLNESSVKAYEKVHIVSHSNAWLGMSLKTFKNGERITVESILKERENNNINVLESGVTHESKIIFHSCGLGENKVLLEQLKQVFTINKELKPTVVASSFFNVFGGKYAGHYLAKPYYGYYPTAESPGPTALSKEFKVSYPNEKIDWYTALKTRKEASLGEPYSYKFNIPVEWEFTFDDSSEIPLLKNRDEIMDWVSEDAEMASTLFALQIPIEKYRWRSKIKGNTLYIKGKTTVLCVLEPILEDNDASEYKNLDFKDDFLYQIL